MKTFMLVAEPDRPIEPLLARLRDELIEAKFQKEKLEVHFWGHKNLNSALALELIAILDFYGAGVLKEYRVEKETFEIIRREIYEDEIIIIDRPTIIEKSVLKGALVIVESALFVAGSFRGTAVLKTSDSSLFASNYQEAKIRTPRRDYYPLTYGAREFLFGEAR